MNPKQNISLINAMIRITLGFMFLAWSTAKLVKRPNQQSYLWIALLAGMKIAEGIVRYCPIVAIFDNKEQLMKKGSQHTSHTSSKDQKAHEHKGHDETKSEHTEKASSADIQNIMSEFNPATIFSPDDMKK